MKNETLVVGGGLKHKRVAISAEPTQNRFNKSKELRSPLKQYSKTEATKEFLKNAIYENDFMKNLESHHIEKIVECMYPVEFEKNSLIIQEGDVGNKVYVTEGNVNNNNNN
jgi:cGMP-dependent protein kinase